MAPVVRYAVAASPRAARAGPVNRGRSAKPSSMVTTIGRSGSGARPASASTSPVAVSAVRPLSRIASSCARNSLGRTVYWAIQGGGSSVTAW